MRTVQDYFETNFKKNSVIIKVEKITETLVGDSLIVKDFLILETLDIEKWEQIKNVIFENCPKLKSIQIANRHQEPITITPPKETDWLCIIGLTSGLIAVFLHIYKWFEGRNKKKEK